MAKLEFSAGGVVYKKENGKTFVLIAQHSYHHGWVFPKGLIGDHIEGENRQDTAVREVKEETGIDGKILKELKPVTYWYAFEGEKRKKTVYYYIMESIGGNFSERDHEMEDVEWIEIDEVMKKLTYKSDKDVFKQAEGLIRKLVYGS